MPEGTLGAAFRVRRWKRGLNQKQAAEEIGVSTKTYCGWETNRSQPDLRKIPGAIRFLGFDWRPQNTTLDARIHRTRTAAGLSIRQLGALIGADPSTVGGWEAGLQAPSRRMVAKLEEWLSRIAESAPTPS